MYEAIEKIQSVALAEGRIEKILTLADAAKRANMNASGFEVKAGLR